MFQRIISQSVRSSVSRGFFSTQSTQFVNAHEWLKNIAKLHPSLREHNWTSVSRDLRHIIHKTNPLIKSFQSFEGVFITPVGEYDKTKDPKLAPLKVVQVNPGAIIPPHDHVGAEFVHILVGSQTDTHGTYFESYSSGPGRVHAVTNLTCDPSYALVGLPEKNKGLKFINDIESLKFLENAYKQAKESYEPHNVFTQLLYIQYLIKANHLDKAQDILKDINTIKILRGVQVKMVDTLKADLTRLTSSSSIEDLKYKLL